MALEYTLTRQFPWPYFTPLSFVGAFIVLVFLATINVVLTGYETITVFQSDYNVTQTHWFDRYIPSLSHKPGTLCDPHVFNVGDSFTTNYTLFQYSIASIGTATAGDFGISYAGATLDDCDVSSLYFNGDLTTSTIDYTALITCKNDEFQFTARTDFSQSNLAGKYNGMLGAVRSSQNLQAGTFNAKRDARGTVLDAVTTTSSADLAARMFRLAQGLNNTAAYPVIISLQVDFPFCPASLGPAAPCATAVPTFTIPSSFVTYSNNSVFEYTTSFPISSDNQPVIDNITETPLANIIQSVYASVRIDLGNPSPNNFLLFPSAVNTTLFATFPRIPSIPEAYSWDTSEEYAALTGATDSNPNITGLFPLSVDGPATMGVVYLCRFQRAKPPGQAFIAVLVATLSMFSSGWAVFLTIAATAAKRHDPAANTCAASPHHARDIDYEKEAFPE